MLLAVLAAISTFAPAEPVAAPAPAPPPGAEAPATGAPQTAAAAAPAKPKDDPIVCKNQVVAGSRLPTKVCMRASEEATRKRSGQDSLNKLQMNNGIRPSGS